MLSSQRAPPSGLPAAEAGCPRCSALEDDLRRSWSVIQALKAENQQLRLEVARLSATEGNYGITANQSPTTAPRRSVSTSPVALEFERLAGDDSTELQQERQRLKEQAAEIARRKQALFEEADQPVTIDAAEVTSIFSPACC